MATLEERILDVLHRNGSMTDAELVRALHEPYHAAVNQACHRLQERGKIRRVKEVGGWIKNIPLTTRDRTIESRPPDYGGSSRGLLESPPQREPFMQPVKSDLLAEDEVKAAVRSYLLARGLPGTQVRVSWGHERGVDIEVRRGLTTTGKWSRELIEAKGEASLQPQQLNYFLNALGELVQRLDDPEASYGLALPDNLQYRRLVARLPLHARRCLKLTVYFVRRGENGLVVSFNDAPGPGGDPGEDKAVADLMALLEPVLVKEIPSEQINRVLRDRPSGWYRRRDGGFPSPP